eukprot:Skav226530  [mRNA]  locus=scaffold1773:265900:268034:- [translate_table: standard]
MRPDARSDQLSEEIGSLVQISARQATATAATPHSALGTQKAALKELATQKEKADSIRAEEAGLSRASWKELSGDIEVSSAEKDKALKVPGSAYGAHVQSSLGTFAVRRRYTAQLEVKTQSQIETSEDKNANCVPVIGAVERMCVRVA